jgi:hypothetical protein
MRAQFLVNYVRGFRKTERVLIVGLTLVLGWVMVLYFVNAARLNPTGNFSTYADDTYIHLRFAHHLTEGWGIVWNKGGQPVEGSTSFFYLLMIAAIEMLGVQPIWALAYTCALFAVLSIMIALLILQKINSAHPVENLTAVILFGLSPRLMIWASTGLEVTLYAFSLALCVFGYILYRAGSLSPYFVGFLFAVSSYIRPECLAVFGVTFGFDLIAAYTSGNKKYQPAFALLTSFLVLYLPVLLWKWSYFGYPFPNTYYAKTGGGMVQIMAGASYLWTNLAETFIPSGLLGILFLATIRKPHYSLEKAYLLLVLLSSWAIVAFNGGDYMLKGRFLTPLFPILFVLAGLGISQLAEQTAGMYRIVLISSLLFMAVFIWHSEKPVMVDRGDAPFPTAKENKPGYIISTPEFVMMGKALHSIAAAGDSIALVPIGAIGFYSDMIVYDMVGLVDPVIAHEPFLEEYIKNSWRPGHDKGDGEYILAQKPTYILLVDRLTNDPVEGVDEWAMQYRSINEIWNSAEFHARYLYCPIRTNGWYINLYCRTANNP